MQFKVTLRTEYQCSLERAFKTPMLCDVRRIHTGMGLMPRVTETRDDAHWGQPGSSKKIYMARHRFHPGGFASVDHVLERKENAYWKIEIDQFQSSMMGFTKFTGEWECREIAPYRIAVSYRYTLHTQNPLWAPFNILFVQLFWKRYMKQVLENIRTLIAEEAPYLYA